MTHSENPFAPSEAASRAPDVATDARSTGVRRTLFAAGTAAGVALVALVLTALRLSEEGVKFDEMLWLVLASIAVLFLLTFLGALLASLIANTAFSALSAGGLWLASACAAILLSILLNADFAELPLPDWALVFPIVCLPILVCMVSLLGVHGFRKRSRKA